MDERTGTVARPARQRWVRITVMAGALAAAVSLLAPSQASAVHETREIRLDFNSDALGASPGGVSPAVGAVEVALDPLLGKALAPREEAKVGLVPNDISLTAAAFDGVIGSNMTVTWREATRLGGDRHAMTLRSYGKVSGYLFAISGPVVETRFNVKQKQNQVAVYRSTDDKQIVELRKADLVGLPARHFRASAVDRFDAAAGKTVTDLKLEYSDDGILFSPVLSVVDDDPLPAGGLQYSGGWDDTDATRTLIDDVVAVFEPRTALNTTTPVDYQVVQRDASNQAAIRVEGTYRLPAGHAAPSAIEARWNGGPWATLVSNPSGGTFSGILANQATGQGALELRFANDHGVTALRRHVGVGDIYAVAGQSNAVGFGWEGQVYNAPAGAPHLKASMLTPDLRWGELRDPFAGGGGSVWPLVATKLLDEARVPVAFVAVAVGGTSINQWQPGTWKYYGSLNDRIVGVGGVKAVLFWQGETDAMTGMSASEYRSKLDNLVGGVWSDFGVDVVVAQIGQVNVPEDNIDPIRTAQQDAWNAGGHALRGPVLYDVDIASDTFKGKRGDGTHFLSTADLQTAADRWWAAMKSHFYGGGDGRGPVLTGATRNAAGTEVTLTFADASLPLQLAGGASGFVVEDGGGVVPVSSTSVSASNAVKLTLSSPLSGPATVSLGKGNTSAGKAVPTDSTAARLPAEAFVRAPIAG